MKIKNLLFDLDATLYPRSSQISTHMKERIIGFVSKFIGLSEEDAAAVRKEGLKKYGTTMEWLLTDYNLKDTRAYFEAVHPDAEKHEVPFDPNLRPFLEELSKKYHLSVLTNAPKIHANCLLNHLNVYDLFDGIYDLEDNNMMGKPHATAFRKAVEEKGFTIEETIFFDDLPNYVKGFTAIGGLGVLVDEENRFDDAVIADCRAYKKVSSIYEIASFL